MDCSSPFTVRSTPHNPVLPSVTTHPSAQARHLTAPLSSTRLSLAGFMSSPPPLAGLPLRVGWPAARLHVSIRRGCGVGPRPAVVAPLCTLVVSHRLRTRSRQAYLCRPMSVRLLLSSRALPAHSASPCNPEP